MNCVKLTKLVNCVYQVQLLVTDTGDCMAKQIKFLM